MGGFLFIVYGLWFKKNCRSTEPLCFSVSVALPEAKKEAVSKEGLTQIAGKAGRH
jgi:hypothetical protein